MNFAFNSHLQPTPKPPPKILSERLQNSKNNSISSLSIVLLPQEFQKKK